MSGKRRITTNYTSADGLGEEEDKFEVINCGTCEKLCLIIDLSSLNKPFEKLPCRSTDSSYILPYENIQKEYFKDGAIKLVKRAKGYEKQHRLNCSECGLWLAYHCGSSKSSCNVLYLVKDAVTSLKQKKNSMLNEFKEDVKKLLKMNPKGIILAKFEAIYMESCGHEIKEDLLGAESNTIKKLLSSLNDDILIVNRIENPGKNVDDDLLVISKDNYI